MSAPPNEQLAKLSLSRENAKIRYKFWETQPVEQFKKESSKDSSACDGPIDDPRDATSVRQEPYALNSQFYWCLCNLEDDDECQEVYDLLRLNYVEDDDEMFRFCYSSNFLRWALCPPGHLKDWHLGVRVKANNKLVGFISGIPADLFVCGHEVKTVEINFLCIHKKLRGKRLAPLLIKEVTRRVNLHGIWQAAYTAGVVLPKPAATCRYWHRTINTRKLIDIGFSRLSERQTLVRVQKLNRLPEVPATPGFRQVQEADYPAVTSLLNTYLAQYSLYQRFSEAELRHFLAPTDNLIYVYVVEAPAGTQRAGEITDLVSFYCLPSSVLNHPDHTELKAAYMYYTAASETPMKQLLNDALIMARTHSFDVFNALNVMENTEALLKDLKFGIGDGNLHYYLFNWRVAKQLEPREVGLILM